MQNTLLHFTLAETQNLWMFLKHFKNMELLEMLYGKPSLTPQSKLANTLSSLNFITHKLQIKYLKVFAQVDKTYPFTINRIRSMLTVMLLATEQLLVSVYSRNENSSPNKINDAKRDLTQTLKITGTDMTQTTLKFKLHFNK